MWDISLLGQVWLEVRPWFNSGEIQHKERRRILFADMAQDGMHLL